MIHSFSRVNKAKLFREHHLGLNDFFESFRDCDYFDQYCDLAICLIYYVPYVLYYSVKKK